MYLEKFLCYLLICSGFVGAALIPIKLGAFTLFPFRVFLLALWTLFVMRVLIQGKVTVLVGAVKSYLLFLGLWLVYAVTSLAWAASKADSARHIVFLSMGVSVIFFTTYYLRTPRDLERLYWIWGIVFFALICLGFWEHLTGQHLPVSRYSEEQLAFYAPYIVARVKNIPTGVFHNPNDYATFLALGFPFGLGLIRYGHKKWLRLIAVVAALVSFYLIVVTSSRANMLAILLEITFLVLFLTNLGQKVRLVLGSALAAGVILTLLPGPTQWVFQSITEELGSILVQAQMGVESVGIRLNLVRNGLDFVYRTAGFGVGAGNAEYWMENEARYYTAGILNPHNWWLEILINYGVFIFLGYVYMYIGLIRLLWRLWHRAQSRAGKMIAEALLLGLIGFAVASASSSSVMALHSHWLFFAFIFAYISRIREDCSARSRNPK